MSQAVVMQRIAIVTAAAVLCAAIPTRTEQMDMEVMMRWGSARVVTYHIVGVYEGRANVVGGSKWIGYADVTDRVEIDLVWDLPESKLVGTPAFRNTKSGVKNLRGFEPKCLPPTLTGEYEHYDLQGIKEGLGGSLEAQVLTIYPGAQVPQFCTGKPDTVPASRNLRPEGFTVISPVAFGMGVPDSDDLRISPDKKSLITKQAGWTWTFTPSILK
jgi:hypothetical protein